MELREVIGPLLFMTSIFMLNILSRTIFGPLMLRVEADLTISHAQAASFFLYTAAGFAISQFLSGFISSRLIHRTVIRATAMAVGLTLTLVAFSPSLWLIRAALFMLGLAAGPYLPSGMATLTALVRQRSWGMAIGIHQLAPNMSFFLGPVLVELLGRFLSWREILLILAALSLGLGSSYGRIARGGRFYGQAPNLSALSSLLTRKAMWIVTVVFSLGVACGMGVYSMLPVYLVVERGLTETEANTLLALARGLAVVGRFDRRLADGPDRPSPDPGRLGLDRRRLDRRPGPGPGQLALAGGPVPTALPGLPLPGQLRGGRPDHRRLFPQRGRLPGRGHGHVRRRRIVSGSAGLDCRTGPDGVWFQRIGLFDDPGRAVCLLSWI